MKKTISTLLYVPRLPILFLIKLYQHTISPDHGLFKSKFPNGFCRFYPSCSEYGYQIIKKNGLVVGIYKTMVRILKCNPWGKGGVDLP
jgi:putative membrane protein insertion efficiency factor